ncbi:MAG: lysophospholipid acyltransferase family protein [Gammaproteobacteria bacterium]|nr:lysophospholipid acyltransferase family protein [Gammaproteobacteria bacterium]
MIKKTAALVDLKKLSNSGSIKFKYSLLLKLIMSFPAFRKIQRWHENAPDNEDFKTYLDSILEQMHVNIEIIGELNIPTSGGCIFVANHPTGLLEVIVWLNTILSIRTDLKMLANNWFDLISVAKDNIISVNNFESKASSKNNVKSLIEAKKWLEKGGALMIFPAGEVAHWNWSSFGIEDPPWKKSVLSLAKKTDVPIIPCYSSSKNSLLFNLVGNIHPRLRTLMLAREFTAKQKKTIKIATNSNVDNDYLAEFSSEDQKMAFVRLSTEALNDKPFAEHLEENQEIADKIDASLIQFEIDQLKAVNETEDYVVYMCYGKETPHILQEIGRLREYNFRLIGEGSGKAIDIDRYDDHYQQLFVWDKGSHRILGGLRLGFCDDREKKGVYFLDHVKIKPRFQEIFQQSIDFGRLFVVDDAPKDLNIILVLVRYLVQYLKQSQYKYLLGQVSIPSVYPKLALDIIASFLTTHYRDEKVYGLVKGKHAFKLTRKYDKYISALMPDIKTSKDVNNLLHKLFQGRIEIPSLLRFYLKCNTKLMSFNYDKYFGTVDALMIIHQDQLPKFFK